MFTHPRANLIEDRLIGRIDAALRERPPKIRPDHPRSPACCWFSGAEVTREIAENVEAVSTTWRRRMLAGRKSPTTA